MTGTRRASGTDALSDVLGDLRLEAQQRGDELERAIALMIAQTYEDPYKDHPDKVELDGVPTIGKVAWEQVAPLVGATSAFTMPLTGGTSHMPRFRASVRFSDVQIFGGVRDTKMAAYHSAGAKATNLALQALAMVARAEVCPSLAVTTDHEDSEVDALRAENAQLRALLARAPQIPPALGIFIDMIAAVASLHSDVEAEFAAMKVAAADFKKDLTRYGIHPQPGPCVPQGVSSGGERLSQHTATEIFDHILDWVDVKRLRIRHDVQWTHIAAQLRTASEACSRRRRGYGRRSLTICLAQIDLMIHKWALIENSWTTRQQLLLTRPDFENPGMAFAYIWIDSLTLVANTVSSFQIFEAGAGFSIAAVREGSITVANGNEAATRVWAMLYTGTSASQIGTSLPATDVDSSTFHLLWAGSTYLKEQQTAVMTVGECSAPLLGDPSNKVRLDVISKNADVSGIASLSMTLGLPEGWQSACGFPMKQIASQGTTGATNVNEVNSIVNSIVVDEITVSPQVTLIGQTSLIAVNIDGYSSGVTQDVNIARVAGEDVPGSTGLLPVTASITSIGAASVDGFLNVEVLNSEGNPVPVIGAGSFEATDVRIVGADGGFDAPLWVSEIRAPASAPDPPSGAYGGTNRAAHAKNGNIFTLWGAGDMYWWTQAAWVYVAVLFSVGWFAHVAVQRWQASRHNHDMHALNGNFANLDPGAVMRALRAGVDPCSLGSWTSASGRTSAHVVVDLTEEPDAFANDGVPAFEAPPPDDGGPSVPTIMAEEPGDEEEDEVPAWHWTEIMCPEIRRAVGHLWEGYIPDDNYFAPIADLVEDGENVDTRTEQVAARPPQATTEAKRRAQDGRGPLANKRTTEVPAEEEHTRARGTKRAQRRMYVARNLAKAKAGGSYLKHPGQRWRVILHPEISGQALYDMSVAAWGMDWAPHTAARVLTLSRLPTADVTECVTVEQPKEALAAFDAMGTAVWVAGVLIEKWGVESSLVRGVRFLNAFSERFGVSWTDAAKVWQADADKAARRAHAYNGNTFPTHMADIEAATAFSAAIKTPIASTAFDPAAKLLQVQTIESSRMPQQQDAQPKAYIVGSFWLTNNLRQNATVRPLETSFVPRSVRNGLAGPLIPSTNRLRVRAIAYLDAKGCPTKQSELANNIRKSAISNNFLAGRRDTTTMSGFPAADVNQVLSYTAWNGLNMQQMIDKAALLHSALSIRSNRRVTPMPGQVTAWDPYTRLPLEVQQTLTPSYNASPVFDEDCGGDLLPVLPFGGLCLIFFHLTRETVPNEELSQAFYVPAPLFFSDPKPHLMLALLAVLLGPWPAIMFGALISTRASDGTDLDEQFFEHLSSHTYLDGPYKLHFILPRRAPELTVPTTDLFANSWTRIRPRYGPDQPGLGADIQIINVQTPADDVNGVSLAEFVMSWRGEMDTRSLARLMTNLSSYVSIDTELRYAYYMAAEVCVAYPCMQASTVAGIARWPADDDETWRQHSPLGRLGFQTVIDWPQIAPPPPSYVGTRLDFAAWNQLCLYLTECDAQPPQMAPLFFPWGNSFWWYWLNMVARALATTTTIWRAGLGFSSDTWLTAYDNEQAPFISLNVQKHFISMADDSGYFRGSRTEKQMAALFSFLFGQAPAQDTLGVSVFGRLTPFSPADGYTTIYNSAVPPEALTGTVPVLLPDITIWTFVTNIPRAFAGFCMPGEGTIGLGEPTYETFISTDDPSTLRGPISRPCKKDFSPSTTTRRLVDDEIYNTRLWFKTVPASVMVTLGADEYADVPEADQIVYAPIVTQDMAGPALTISLQESTFWFPSQTATQRWLYLAAPFGNDATLGTRYQVGVTPAPTPAWQFGRARTIPFERLGGVQSDPFADIGSTDVEEAPSSSAGPPNPTVTPDLTTTVLSAGGV